MDTTDATGEANVGRDIYNGNFYRMVLWKQNYIPLTIYGQTLNIDWTENDSCYMDWSGDFAFMSDVNISDSSKLCFIPGSRIHIRKDSPADTTGALNMVEINIAGELECIGANDTTIIFDCIGDTFNEPVEPGDWYGIVVNDGGKADIQYAEINYPYIGVDVDTSTADTVNIEHTTIYRPELAGVRTQCALTKVDSCVVDSTGIYGIHTVFPVTNTDTVYITNNTITTAVDYPSIGIYGLYSKYLKLINNNIECGLGIVLYDCDTASIIGCGIYNSIRDGIALSACSKVLIDSCEIIGDTIATGIEANGCANITVRNSVLDSFDIGVYTISNISNDMNLGDSAAADSGKNSIILTHSFCSYGVVNGNADTIKAEYNWWGTANTRTILSKMSRDGIRLTVDCLPILTANPWASKSLSNNTLPNEFELLGNIPNPFNATTSIQYRLPERCEVVLSIYNISGRRVVILDIGNANPGMNEIIWEGRSSSGADAPSGVYYYSIKARGASGMEYDANDKMVLIR